VPEGAGVVGVVVGGEPEGGVTVPGDPELPGVGLDVGGEVGGGVLVPLIGLNVAATIDQSVELASEKAALTPCPDSRVPLSVPPRAFVPIRPSV
jgi:hypothetical protein